MKFNKFFSGKVLFAIILTIFLIIGLSGLGFILKLAAILYLIYAFVKLARNGFNFNEDLFVTLVVALIALLIFLAALPLLGLLLIIFIWYNVYREF